MAASAVSERTPLLGGGDPFAGIRGLSRMPEGGSSGAKTAMVGITPEQFRQAIQQCCQRGAPRVDGALAGGRVANSYSSNWFLKEAMEAYQAYVAGCTAPLNMAGWDRSDFAGFKSSFHESMRPMYTLLATLFKLYAHECMDASGAARPWLKAALTDAGITEKNYPFAMLICLIGVQFFYYARHLAHLKPDNPALGYMSAIHVLLNSLARSPPAFQTFFGRLCSCFCASDPFTPEWCEQAFENYLSLKAREWGGGVRAMGILSEMATTSLQYFAKVKPSGPDEWIKLVIADKFEATEAGPRRDFLQALMDGLTAADDHPFSGSRSFHNPSSSTEARERSLRAIHSAAPGSMGREGHHASAASAAGAAPTPLHLGGLAESVESVEEEGASSGSPSSGF